MDILSSIQLNPRAWPLAVMVFLRITTIFFFLPIFGEQSVPSKFKISFAILLTFFLYPIVSEHVTQADNLLQWSPVTLAIASLREVFFGFSTGFAAKLVIYGTSIASHTIGVNMGFQVSSMFSPGINDHESAYSVMNNWLVIMLILILNIHHIFLEGIAKSFIQVPIGASANSEILLKVVVQIIHESFALGLRLAAPLIAVQILINISMGLLNRALPSLNVFVVSFPVSFILTLTVLFLSISSLLRLLGTYGMEKEVMWIETMRRVFSH